MIIHEKTGNSARGIISAPPVRFCYTYSLERDLLAQQVTAACEGQCVLEDWLSKKRAPGGWKMSGAL